MPHPFTRRRLLAAGLATSVFAPVTLRAQVWPTKPVKIICAFPPGGITDLYSRAYGEYIAQKSGQTVIVENRPGAGGSVACQALKAAPADNHTLLTVISSTLLGNRIAIRNLPYDPDKDFALISMMSTGHLPLVAHKVTGATNLAQFVDYARKNRVSFGSYAAGSFAHIVCHELNRAYNLDMTLVNYRGEAPMWNDILSGSSQCAIGSYQAARGAIDTGTGVPIAVQTTRRMSKLPNVATYVEQGLDLPALKLLSWAGLLGQASMPQEIVQHISSLMVEAGKSERIQKLTDTFGVDDAAQDHATFKHIYDTQGPVWLEAVGKLGLTPG
ncbi:Bug family tripartite tricarboxylate transporter substrate binding protein [Phreatobacter sp.]|uniref:Bug family tripartite tricarboxylate transporter substrate binding protein n=1 Tax=Phreatobacter sp. TaxID=1966341 RepID=UPI003F6ED091